MATVQDIINAAYGYSLKNQPGALATEPTELTGVVNRAQRKYFAGGGRVNPGFYGESAVVAFGSTGWARPGNAETVWRIEDPTPVEVVVVPYDDLQAETMKPAVYRWGQEYRGAGNTGDPTAGNLTFFYSKVADALTQPTDTLDTFWPEQFNELLILEVAFYLAAKDGRQEEYEPLLMQLREWQQLYIRFLEHETVNERRRFGQLKRFNVEELFPIPAGIGG